VNPRIGSGLKYGRRVKEEQTVGVVRNHAGGTRMGSGFPIPKEARGGAETRRRMRPGVGLRGLNDGGAIFGQPQERKPGFAAGSQGPVSVGRVAPRSGGSGKPGRKCWQADRSRVRKGPVLEDRSTATCSKVTEGSGERPGSRRIDRIFPAQAVPAGCGHMERTMSQRECSKECRRSTGTANSLLRQPIRNVARGEEQAPEGPVAPEDQVNPILDRRAASRLREEAR